MKAFLYLILAAISPLIGEISRKAGEGDPEAIYRLSIIYEHGYDSIPADTARSVSLLREAARLGHAPAANYLGFLYSRGELLTQNADSARYWIARAAAAGDPKAANNLAYMLLEAGTPAADSIALPYLAQAAEAGLPTAITTLANMYAAGRAVKPDTLRAVSLYDEAISLGFRDAELYLLNLKGPEWVRMNPADRLRTSLHYWRTGSALIGAELLAGLPAPDAIIGAFREKGEEGLRSPAEGLTAEEAGRAYALLGHAYSHGAGVPYDHALANKYFIAASLLGDPAASFILAETLEIFPDVFAEMTPDGLREYAASRGVTDARSARDALTAPLSR